MKSYCAFCCKPFEAKNAGQEFCKPECRSAFAAADRAFARERRLALREGAGHIPGAIPCVGGRMAKNRGLSDQSDWT